MIRKICINDICYDILRIIKNGTSYGHDFLVSLKNNIGADTMVNDNQGNILMCKTMLTYELDTEKNIWQSTIVYHNPDSLETKD